MSTTEQQNYTKDYSLLRKFDLEAAKNGDEICNTYEVAYWDFIAGIDAENKCVLLHIPSNTFVVSNSVSLRMKPLAWVEGKPVYKGDVLYVKEGMHGGLQVTIVDLEPNVQYLTVAFGEVDVAKVEISSLTWNKPKVKREGWINVYPNLSAYGAFATKQMADDSCGSDRVACIRIEWEE